MGKRLKTIRRDGVSSPSRGWYYSVSILTWSKKLLHFNLCVEAHLLTVLIHVTWIKYTLNLICSTSVIPKQTKCFPSVYDYTGNFKHFKNKSVVLYMKPLHDVKESVQSLYIHLLSFALHIQAKNYQAPFLQLQWNLVCDRRILDPIANSLFFFGYFIGSAAHGPIADWLVKVYKRNLLLHCCFLRCREMLLLHHLRPRIDRIKLIHMNLFCAAFDWRILFRPRRPRAIKI